MTHSPSSMLMDRLSRQTKPPLPYFLKAPAPDLTQFCALRSSLRGSGCLRLAQALDLCPGGTMQEQLIAVGVAP
jgi:hypothetical protein